MTKLLTKAMNHFIFIVTLSVSTNGIAAPLFTDSFESGDLSHTDNNFSWAWGREVSVSKDISHSGAYSLKFKYRAEGDPVKINGTAAASAVADPYSHAEQRFNLGGSYPEIWMQFYIYYTDGTEGLGAKYTHRNGSNNKFFRLWGPDKRVTSGASTWGSNDNSHLGLEHSRVLCDGTVKWGMGQVDVAWAENVFTKANLGKWRKIKFHMTVASPANNDRIFQMWVDDVLVTDRQDLKGYPGDECNAYTAGYLLGWANSGYAEETNIYIDDFEVSYGPGQPNQALPNPPLIE